MIHMRVTEKDIDMMIDIASGRTLKDVATVQGVTAERIRQKVYKFCRIYLQKVRDDGTPEHFYPGNDNRHDREDTSIDDSYYSFLGINSLDEVREQRDWWLHQMALLRVALSRRKAISLR